MQSPQQRSSRRNLSRLVVEPLLAPDRQPVLAQSVLAESAGAMRGMGNRGWIIDSARRLRFVTDEQRLSLAADIEMTPIPIGEHLFGPEMTEMTEMTEMSRATSARWLVRK